MFHLRWGLSLPSSGKGDMSGFSFISALTTPTRNGVRTGPSMMQTIKKKNKMRNRWYVQLLPERNGSTLSAEYPADLLRGSWGGGCGCGWGHGLRGWDC